MRFFNLDKYKTELEFLAEILNDSNCINGSKLNLLPYYIRAEKLYIRLSDDIEIFIVQYKDLIGLVSKLNNKVKEIYLTIISSITNNDYKMVLKDIINKLNDNHYYIITNQISKKTQIPLLINKFIKSIEKYLQLVSIFLDQMITFYDKESVKALTTLHLIEEYSFEIETGKSNLVSQFKQLSKNRRNCDYAFYIGKNSLSKVNKDISKSEMLRTITLSFS